MLSYILTIFGPVRKYKVNKYRVRLLRDASKYYILMYKHKKCLFSFLNTVFFLYIWNGE